ncbi:MAG: hypothetical protein LBV56_02425 [Delftia acidovorans]|nr:hypothetical protein [Delftia acidovorans]
MNPPEKLLTDLYWSFAEPLPGNAQLMEAALREYHEGIECGIDERQLQSRLPLSGLDIIFKYHQRSADGQWLELPAVVQIRRAIAPMPAELLLELHFAVADLVSEQDHHFFEGLWLCEQQGSDGLPVYELYLGS